MTDGIAVLPPLNAPDDRPAVRVAGRELSYRDLAAAATAVAGAVASASRVAVLATPTLETVVGVVGAVLAGVPVVPVNPSAGERELAHILADADPDLLLHPADAELPAQLQARARLTVEPAPGGHHQRTRRSLTVRRRSTPRSSSSRRAPRDHPRVSCCRGARWRAIWTRSRGPGRGRRTTWWPTHCRCSTCTG